MENKLNHTTNPTNRKELWTWTESRKLLVKLCEHGMDTVEFFWNQQTYMKINHCWTSTDCRSWIVDIESRRRTKNWWIIHRIVDIVPTSTNSEPDVYTSNQLSTTECRQYTWTCHILLNKYRLLSKCIDVALTTYLQLYLPWDCIHCHYNVPATCLFSVLFVLIHPCHHLTCVICLCHCMCKILYACNMYNVICVMCLMC